VRRASSGPGGFLPRFVPMFVFDHASRAKGVWSDPARVLLLRLSARRAAPSDEHAQSGFTKASLLSIKYLASASAGPNGCHCDRD
jgi:hypothetical protein